MRNKINQIDNLNKLRFEGMSKLNKALAIRGDFINDPVMTINAIDNDDIISADILKFKKIFGYEHNITIAKEDALSIINDSVIGHMDAISTVESELTKLLNSILGMPYKHIVDVKVEPEIRIAGYGPNVWSSALPIVELVTKVVNSKSNEVMTKAGVSACDIVDWLYGITKSIDSESIIGMMERIDVPSVTSYILNSDDVPATLPVIDDVPDDSVEYGELSGCVVSAPDNLGVVPAMTELTRAVLYAYTDVGEVAKDKKELDVLTDTNILSDAKATIMELLDKDSATINSDITSVINSANDAMIRYAYAARSTSINVIAVYRELLKLKQAYTLILDISKL